MTDFSRAQLDDAILARYDEMVQAARQSFYASTADAIRAAARELVAERWLTSELAEAAVTEAIALAARGGRSG